MLVFEFLHHFLHHFLGWGKEKVLTFNKLGLYDVTHTGFKPVTF